FSLTSSTGTADASLYYAKSSPVQVILPSLVVHGMQPDPTVAAAMPRRLNPNGDEVATPGIGLEYKSQSGLLLLGAVIKDCFDDLAGTVQVGGNWRINRNSD